jgi:hypothetical protein
MGAVTITGSALVTPGREALGGREVAQELAGYGQVAGPQVDREATIARKRDAGTTGPSPAGPAHGESIASGIRDGARQPDRHAGLPGSLDGIGPPRRSAVAGE